jgi:hypothetical protein
MGKMALPWTDIINQIGGAIRQVLPDPRAQAEFDLKWGELAAQAEARENDLARAQIEVNKTEATHANLFVAGWRPAIGWVGAISLAYSFIARPLLEQVGGFDMPNLDLGELITIVGAMLGIGAMRTTEKLNGVATSVNGRVLRNERPANPPVPADLNGLV